MANLIAGGFQGLVSPVNPKAEVVWSILAYKSVRAIKAPVDLCVLAVPPEAVLKVADAAHAGLGVAMVASVGNRDDVAVDVPPFALAGPAAGEVADIACA